MKISIKRSNEDYGMEAVNDTGNTVFMDGSEQIGGQNKGMRPMQLLLTALGGCTSIDVISIFKKQKLKIDNFEVDVDGDSVKEGGHSVYKTICITFKIDGDISIEKAKRAIELSLNTYCSVSKALEYSSEISYKLILNGVEE